MSAKFRSGPDRTTSVGALIDAGKAPLNRQGRVLPDGHAALQHGNGLVAQVRQRGARKRGLAPIVAGYGDGRLV